MKTSKKKSSIPYEHGIATICIAVCIALLDYGNFFAVNHVYQELVSLLLLLTGLHIMTYLLKQTRDIVIYGMLVALMTFPLHEFAVHGFARVIIVTLACTMFVLVKHLLRQRSEWTQHCTATIGFACVQSIGSAWMLSPKSYGQYLLQIGNLVLLTIAIAFFFSVVSHGVWSLLKKTKAILKVESYLMTLADAKHEMQSK